MSGVGRTEWATCRDMVLPAVQAAGWQMEDISEQFPLHGPGSGPSGASTRGAVDYVLSVGGTPVAVVEAKREQRSAADGIHQSLRYAAKLDVPLAYSTNGREIVEHNLILGTEATVPEFMAPAAAWAEYARLHGLDDVASSLVAEPFNRRLLGTGGNVVTPRYYQLVAINRVLAAIGRGERRVLLLMATGTGKTFTAMQIVAKLRSFEAVVHPDRNYRVLYLADRDQLLAQPMGKDFTAAFGRDVLKRVLGAAEASREVYFATYQALSGGGVNEELFRDFPPGFFDLVIVDECHRGSADADSAWRSVLDYFTSAIHLGLTATPRNDSVNSYEYFGNPVFEYSLRQGIEDGFLAPYRVRRVVLSPDADGWEPGPGQTDRYGNEIPDGLYSTRDFERVVSLLARTRLAARHLSGVLRATPGERCIVFCVDVEHADDVRRSLIDENPDLMRADPEWVVRLVGVEGEKARLLEEFCDPDASTPVVATTSKLLSTGVDIPDLRYVVLFRPVGSMVEFKQIIGRGTRLYPDKGKWDFEIIDYVGATEHFTDPDFDGYPAHIRVETVDGEGQVVGSIDEPAGASPGTPETTGGPEVQEPEPVFAVHDPPVGAGGDAVGLPPRRKYFVDDGDFNVVAEVRSVVDTSGGGLRLTEYGQWVKEQVEVLGAPDEIEAKWVHADSRHRLLEALRVAGVDLAEIVRVTGSEDCDPLDALLSVAWNVPQRTRAERVRGARERHATELGRLSKVAREVIEALLARYEAHGVGDLETPEVYRLSPVRELGSPVELAEELGGPEGLVAQLNRVQEMLYAA